MIQRISDTEGQYRVFLVTNRHVFENSSIAYLRFNPKADEPAREYKAVLRDQKGKPIWFTPADPQADVAILLINPNLLEKHLIKFSYFQSDRHVVNRAKANELGITEGDGVFVLGFPMELVGQKRNFVIVRQGTIARIRDALTGASNEFLVDATIFPGNSGGPVVLKPEAMAIQGTNAQGSAWLIGIVKSYVAYREMAISAQTNRPRIIFEENSGLAEVVPIDFVTGASRNLISLTRLLRPHQDLLLRK